MNIFVLYDKSGIHSGRALGRKLTAGFPTAKVEMGRPGYLSELVGAGRKFDFIINVGWFGELDTGGGRILNSPKAIAVSSNKLKARRRFVEKNIMAPDLWEDHRQIPNDAYPVVARTTHHSKGRGFWFCKNAEEAAAAQTATTMVKKKLVLTRKGNRVWRERTVRSEGASHFIKFIPRTREFRAHVMSSKADLGNVRSEDYMVLKLSEKVPAPGGFKSKIIKNHDNGWIFLIQRTNRTRFWTGLEKPARKL